jgi:hypothetical protein
VGGHLSSHDNLHAFRANLIDVYTDYPEMQKQADQFGCPGSPKGAGEPECMQTNSASHDRSTRGYAEKYGKAIVVKITATFDDYGNSRNVGFASYSPAYPAPLDGDHPCLRPCKS